MQSAVIIETPRSCSECQLKQIKVLGHTPVYACLLSRKLIIGEGILRCPLKPLPEPIPFASDEYTKGYNACLDDLTHI